MLVNSEVWLLRVALPVTLLVGMCNTQLYSKYYLCDADKLYLFEFFLNILMFHVFCSFAGDYS